MDEFRQELTILLMASPHINVNVSTPSMVGRVKVRQFGKKWAGIPSQRVKVKLINAEDCELRLDVSK